MIRFLLMLLIVSFFLVVGYTNQEQMISLHFFGGMETDPIRLYLIVAATFIIGFLLSTILFCPGWIRSILDRRKKSKRIEQLEIDLDRMRSATIRGESSSLQPSSSDVNEEQSSGLSQNIMHDWDRP